MLFLCLLILNEQNTWNLCAPIFINNKHYSMTGTLFQDYAAAVNQRLSPHLAPLRYDCSRAMISAREWA